MKSRKSNRNSKKSKFWRKYNFEILIFSLIIIGIFLIIEDLNIKNSILSAYIQIYDFLIKLFLTLYVTLTTLLYGVENSDLFGLGLIVFAIFLILLKWRQNLLNEYSIYEVCRHCNNRIHRIKRRKRIKIFAYIFRLKIKRYQCTACNQVGYIIRPL